MTCRKGSSGLLECLECGLKFKTLTSHLNAKHNMTCDQYKRKHGENLKIICGSTAKILADKIKGDKNPGYQHGGKLSSWSKKSIYYSEKSIEKMKKNHTTWTKIEYWIKKGHSEEEAKQIISQKQNTFNLEKCIEKYGEVKGLQRWTKRQEKWQETLNSKTDEEKELINQSKATRINYRSLWCNEISDPGIFYIIKWNDTNDIKIGITSKDTVKKRHSRNLRDFEIIKEYRGHTLGKCFEIEQFLLRKFSEDRKKDKTSTENFPSSMQNKLLTEIEILNNESYESIKNKVRKLISDDKLIKSNRQKVH